MAVLDDVKRIIRMQSSMYDDELNMLIDACKYDLRRCGVVVDDDSSTPELVLAIACYVKANFGLADVSNKEFWAKLYNNYRIALTCDQTKRR